LGYIAKNEGKGQPYHNSLCLIHSGNIEYVYHKRLLPVYNIFDEARHFAPGHTPGIYIFKEMNLGFLICEDGWADSDNYLYSCDPVDDLVKSKLDMIICLNGSPNNVGKLQERVARFSRIAKRAQAPLLFTNQIGGNDDIVFDGTSFVIDKTGHPAGCLKQFAEDVGIVTVENANVSLDSHFQAIAYPKAVEIFYQQTILGLADYVNKSGFKSVVIGLSGGIDSALTLALAAKALGPDQITALTMPSRYSSTGSVTDSQQLCDNFKVRLYNISIEEELSFALKQYEKIFHEQPSSITEQNIQARLRGRILMEYSNQTGALVLSTGNKSELSVGYTTLYGDMTGGFNLIGDLYKTDVYQLANYINQRHPDTLIPQVIIQKIPSAELAPNQKDSDTLPEYDELDPILRLYIEGDLLPKQEYQAYQQLISHLSPELISQVHRMVDNAEFKRRQSAPIVRVQRRAFGYGRQLPIAATYPKALSNKQ
jgi:NAD+ synthetase